MRQNPRRSRARAAALRIDSKSLIEPGIAFVLAMFAAWALSAR